MSRSLGQNPLLLLTSRACSSLNLVISRFVNISTFKALAQTRASLVHVPKGIDPYPGWLTRQRAIAIGAL
jgi:hypothetical protein